HQRRDLPAALPQRPHRRVPSRQHPAEGGAFHAGRARRLRPRARTARPLRDVAPPGEGTERRCGALRMSGRGRWTYAVAMKLLIAYDGSADAKAAVAWAGHLFDGSTAVVLTVWEGFSEVVSRASAGLSSTFDFDQINAQCAQWARERAVEGAG